MLKFQDDYTTLITTFADFILLVYVMVDDIYKQFITQTILKKCIFLNPQGKTCVINLRMNFTRERVTTFCLSVL